MYVCMYEWNGMEWNGMQCSAVQCNAMQLLVLSFSLLFLYYYDYLLLSLYNIVSYVCLFLSFCTLVGTGKLGDPREHKIKRRQSYREQLDLSSDEEVIFRKKTFAIINLERNQLHTLTEGGSYCNIKCFA